MRNQPWAGLVSDLRFAVRSLRQRRGISLAVIATLGLGIGATSALFSVVYAVLLRPLPVADPERVVMVYQQDRITGTVREPSSVPDYYDLAARARSFETLGAFTSGPVTIGAKGVEPASVNATRVTHGLLRLLGTPPRLGRDFTVADDAPDGPKVVVLSDALWRSRFLADPGAVGRSVRLDDGLYTVVGVAPPGVELPGIATDLWVPLQHGPASTPRTLHNVLVVGRLARGTSAASAGREVGRIGAQLEAEYPESNRGRGMAVETLTEVAVGGVRPALLLLLGAVTLLLLVACVNVASLLLAQSWGRAREFALRRTLGASTGRLARQFLLESLLLTGTAAVLGVLLTGWGLDLLIRLAPADLPRLSEVKAGNPVLVAALGLSVLTGVGFGLLPLAQAWRLDLHAALQGEGGRTASSGPARRRLRDALVVGEIALSALLVIGAGLLVRSLYNLRVVDPGFRSEQVMKLQFRLPASRYPQSFADYPDWNAIIGLHRGILERTSELPGVRSAALAGYHPLDPGFTNSFVIEGRESEFAQQPEIPVRPVSPGYFATLGIPLRRGRMLDARDVVGSPDVLLINQAAARRFFAGREPIGQRLAFWGRSRTIVGIVADEHFRGVAEDAPPAVYPPIAQVPVASASLLVRAEGDLTGLVPAIREVVWSLDPQVALSDIEPLSHTLAASLARPRFTTLLLGGFAALGVVLACVGIHGVLSYAVTQRTRELGIRLALGAPRRRVLGQIVGQSLALTLVGIGIGLAGGLGLTRLLRSLLFGVAPTDPAVFAATAVSLAAVGIAASCLPARRASRVDPMIALRSE
ncbi:MAG TPA: ABC transporter permease [Gemmatimonadales bacterium]